MNLRSEHLRRLCYEFDCMLQIPGVCTGGTGEPCHANWAWAGKGGAMKAHDCFVVPGCRACHNELDQGRTDGEAKMGYWLRAFGKFLPALFKRGFMYVATAIAVAPSFRPATEAQTLGGNATRSQDGTLPQRKRRGSKRGTHCLRPEGALPRRYTTR